MFDKKEIYNTEVKNLVEDLKRVCHENGIPMHASFAVSDDGKETTYKNEMISAFAAKAKLTENNIAKHAKIDAGFDDYIEELRSVNMDDFQDVVKNV